MTRISWISWDVEWWNRFQLNYLLKRLSCHRKLIDRRMRKVPIWKESRRSSEKSFVVSKTFAQHMKNSKPTWWSREESQKKLALNLQY